MATPLCIQIITTIATIKVIKRDMENMARAIKLFKKWNRNIRV